MTALAFAGLRIDTELSTAEDFDRIVSQVDTSMLITEVVHQLQGERGAVASAVADGSIANNEDTANVFRQTDAAISELRDKIGILDLADAESKGRYNYAFNKLSQLAPLRNLARSGTYPDLAVLSAYNAVIDPLVQLGRELTTAGNATGQGPSRLSAAVQTIGQAKERASQLDALLMVSAVRNSFRSSTVQNEAEAAAAGFDSSIAEFFAIATPDEQQQYNDGYSGTEVDKRRDFAQAALSGSDPNAPLDFDLKTLRDASTAANNKLRGVETNLIASLRTQASGLASEATATAWKVALIVVGAMLAALALMLAMTQSLVNPLRRLRRGALKVANVTLPKTIERILDDANPVEAAKNAVAPMPVDTSEEIGQVARSFDVVHERAVRLATEQAVLRDNVNDMFVNLSRRTQALVERQLSELDKLEQNEQDPDQLAQFFVLDHLAARMRRNSENLLILSGVGVARRSSKPVPITEVIGAAQSEIENYARVVVTAGPDTLVQGRVVNDVVHLMAELLDNATKFSAADTKVTVTSTHVRSGELAVQISDSGLGLSEEELADINKRLVNPPPFDLAVSRRMGLYVVARLAKRHDIKVRLHGEFNSGTSAVVVLPKSITSPAPPASPPPPPVGSKDPTEVRGGLTTSLPTARTGATTVADNSGQPTTVHNGPHSVTRMQPVARPNQTAPTSPVPGPHTSQTAPVTGSGPQPVQTGPGTGPQRIPTGPSSGPLPVPTGPGTGTERIPTGPSSGPLPVPTGPGTGTERIPTGPSSGPLPVQTGPGTGPQRIPTGPQPDQNGPGTGKHAAVQNGPGTGKHAAVKGGPGTGKHPSAPSGPGTGKPPAQNGPGTGKNPAVKGGRGTGKRSSAQSGPGTGQHPAVRNGPSTGQQPAVRNGPSTGQQPAVRNGPSTGQQPAVRNGPGTGQQPAIRTGPPSGPQPVQSGPGTGRHPAVRNGPATGQQPAVRNGPATGQQPAVRNGPGTGQQPAVQSGPPSGPQRVQGGPPSGPQPVRNGPGTGQHPAVPRRSEPAHAASEGLARSPWFQRTVPANLGNQDGNGNGAGKGNGNGSTGKGKKNGKRVDPDALSSSALNWRATAGDDGWSAVRRKLGDTAQQSKVSDQLPRRTPGSRLVPGSAGERRLAGGTDDVPETEPPSQPWADGVRSRLTGFKQGLDRARGEHEPPDHRPGDGR
jgi:signal transduction histidine kinase